MYNFDDFLEEYNEELDEVVGEFSISQEGLTYIEGVIRGQLKNRPLRLSPAELLELVTDSALRAEPYLDIDNQYKKKSKIETRKEIKGKIKVLKNEKPPKYYD